MLLRTAVVLLCVTLPAPATADVRDYLGKPLADVRVEVGGRPVLEPSVLELVETRVGETLSMEQVRATIDHLIGLGRFEDIQVFAEPAAGRPGAVSLRWALVPVQRITRIDIANAALDESALRAAITERLGAAPTTSRVDELVAFLRTYYADRGYRQASIDARIAPAGSPDAARLTLSIQPGVRTTIGEARVTGAPPQPAPEILARLNLEHGRPYDRPALDARVAAYEDSLRELGHYEAAVDPAVTFPGDGRVANVTLRVEPGPRVRVVFAGDALPENRRETLVPIRQERSVDLDLLEDASRNIETFLRQQGYRAAQASYTRETRGGETVLTFTVARGPLHRLAGQEITGNEAIPLAELQPLLKLEPGEPFVDSRVGAVAAAITELYRVRGFSRAAVTPAAAILPPRDQDSQQVRPVNVRFVVAEGVRTSVGEVRIDGASALPQERLRGLLTLAGGRPFYRPLVDADRHALEQAYRNEGFQNVRVDVETTAAASAATVDVRWVIREGPQTLIDHVLVTGNARTSSDLIRREAGLQSGRALGEDALVDSQQRLAALGLFRRIRITQLPHGAGANRDVLIDVEEAPPTSISFGGGVEVSRRLRQGDAGRAVERIDVAPRGFFQVSRRNLWGKNRSISLFTRVTFRPRDPAIDSTDPTDEGGYGFNEYRVVGTFREPRPFDRPGDAQLTGFLEQAVRSSFNFSRRGVRGEYARRLDQGLTISGRYTFDYTRLFDAQIAEDDRPLVDRLFPQVRLSTFTGSVARDTRSDAVDPERGSVLAVDGSIAPRFIGSEVGFARTFLQSFIYRRLPGERAFVFAAGARLGLAVGFARAVPQLDENERPVLDANGAPVVEIDNELPASERFFGGGDTTVRGFQLDRLGAEGTLDAQGYPRGGNAIVVLNAELRSPHWKSLQAVGFVDAGNVFERASHLSLADLRPTAGFGIRFRSPIGPLRFDLGFNLDRRMLRSGAREGATAFHISLGQAF